VNTKAKPLTLGANTRLGWALAQSLAGFELYRFDLEVVKVGRWGWTVLHFGIYIYAASREKRSTADIIKHHCGTWQLGGYALDGRPSVEGLAGVEQHIVAHPHAVLEQVPQ